MLLETIKQQITESLKKGDHVRLDTLRICLSAIRNAGIDKYGAQGESAMTEADVIDVLKKQAKTRKESIEAFNNGNRPELAQKEQQELAVIEEYLPKELSDEEIKTILQPLATSGEKNFGLLMKQAMPLIAGKADGGRVSAVLKTLIKD